MLGRGVRARSYHTLWRIPSQPNQTPHANATDRRRAMIAYLVAYHTYGRWLARKVFRLSADAPVPSVELNDDRDFVPTDKSVLFGHHFTSIAGTGPIVGPAIAVMWGWLPALIWVLLGSILVGAVHDFGSLIVSVRSQGQTVGDVAGRVLNRRVRLLFLLVLFMALTIVLAIFGLVIASVFKLYPAAIFPCLVQIPLAVMIGVWLHRKQVNLLVPSILAFGDDVPDADLRQPGDPGRPQRDDGELVGDYLGLIAAGLLLCCFRASGLDAVATSRLHQLLAADHRVGIGGDRIGGRGIDGR